MSFVARAVGIPARVRNDDNVDQNYERLVDDVPLQVLNSNEGLIGRRDVYKRNTHVDTAHKRQSAL